MTPEQRDTLGVMLQWYGNRLLGHEGSRPEWTALIKQRNALRAALVERTCGTCANWHSSFSTSRRGSCDRFDQFMSDDDGCIKGWTPKEPTR